MSKIKYDVSSPKNGYVVISLIENNFVFCNIKVKFSELNKYKEMLSI